MNIIMQKIFRLFSPGIYIVICCLPFLKMEKMEIYSKAFSGDVFIYVIFIFIAVIGLIYYGFDIRSFLWKPIVQECHEKVWNQLIMPHYSDPIVQQNLIHITDKKVMRIFFRIIDNDPSLSLQSNMVRFNGTALTTIIDGVLIFPLFILLYFIVLFLSNNFLFLCLGILLIIFQFIWFVLKIRLFERHLQLQQEQIDIIKQSHNETVLEALRALTN